MTRTSEIAFLVLSFSILFKDQPCFATSGARPAMLGSRVPGNQREPRGPLTFTTLVGRDQTRWSSPVESRVRRKHFG
jgi:hypothetical protein